MCAQTAVFIAGQWGPPLEPEPFVTVNPATGAVLQHWLGGGAADIAAAVTSAQGARAAMAALSRAARLQILRDLRAAVIAHSDDFAALICAEMGAPIALARGAHIASSLCHFDNILTVLETYAFEERRPGGLLRREPIGVAGLITPWNWPLHLIVIKVVNAIAAGCPMVLKPSEITPGTAALLTRLIAQSALPNGAFNMVGGGQRAGAALAGHPGIDMISLTGSLRAGMAVAGAAAPGMKRVVQELGGNAANIVLEDADPADAIRNAVIRGTRNSGQSCNAPTRLLLPRAWRDTAIPLAVEAARGLIIGDPQHEATEIGPVASRAQYQMLHRLFARAAEQGVICHTGGAIPPAGLEQGYFVAPTILEAPAPCDVTRNEVFGPVIVLQFYDTLAQAIALAEDTPWGLQSFLQTRDAAKAAGVIAAMRTGQVSLNYAGMDFTMPFGGMKASGNGREGGIEGLGEYLELKSVLGMETLL